MPRDVSGTYTAPSNSFNPAVDGTDIEPADWNAILIDLVGQGLNVLPASLITGDLKLANFNSGTGASSTTFWRGDRTWSPAVIGPGVAVDNAAARFDATTGSLIQNSPLLIADTTGSLSRSGNGGIPLQGTNTNDSAAAGYVGEYVESVITSGSSVSLTSGIVANITSISLTAGDWDVFGSVSFLPTASTSVTSLVGSLSLTTAALSSPYVFNDRSAAFVSGGTSPLAGYNLGRLRVNVSSTTSVFLVAVAAFTASTLGGFGFINARRVR